MSTFRSVQDWLAHTPNLKKSGHEWVGPCPYCGGTDRFHLRDRGGRAVVGCRGCIDGHAPDARRHTFLRIVEIVFGGRPPPPRDYKADNRARLVAEQQEKKAAQAAAWKAHRIILAAKLQQHQYLCTKGFPGTLGLVHDGQLIVPIRDAENSALLSAQLIDRNGKKIFLPGSRVKGGTFRIGPSDAPRWLVEGYATGLSVKAALATLTSGNALVVVCFSASNILAVAQPGDRIIADSDHHDVGAKAARESGCEWWMPPELGMDANDWHLQYGIDDLINELRPLCRTLPSSRARRRE